MGKLIDVMSHDSSLMLRYDGRYVSLRKRESTGVFYPGILMDTSSGQPDESNIIWFDINVHGEGIDEAQFYLSTNRAYSGTDSQYLEYSASDGRYIIGSSNSTSSQAQLMLEQAQGGLYKLKDLSDGSPSAYLSVIPDSSGSRSAYLGRADENHAAAEFELEIVDRPDTFSVEDGDVFYISPRQDNISHWLTGSFRRDSMDNLQIAGFRADRPTRLDLGTQAKTFYFQMQKIGDWVFADSAALPTNAIMLGVVCNHYGMSVAGAVDRITTEAINPQGDIDYTCLKVTVAEACDPKFAAYSFVFRATHCDHSNQKVTYSSKDPTATEREPQ